MSPLVILLMLGASVSWGLFGWLIAWWLKRESADDVLPLWPIILFAAAAPVFVWVSGVAEILGIE
jgi:hypothetical protein